MKSYLSRCAVLLTAMTLQTSAFAQTDYVATGSFIYEILEVIQYDYENDEENYLDAFVAPQPFNIQSSTFTLRFSVDETVDHDFFLFNPTAYFDHAVSNVSLDINGVTVLNDPVPTANVGQNPGDFQGLYPQSWFYSLYPDLGSIQLPELTVIENNTFEELGTIVPEGFSFSLTDSTRQVYNDGYTDLILLDLDNFDGTRLELFWGVDYENYEESEYFEDPPDIYYSVTGTVDTLTTSPVPLPASVWLMLSAISGLLLSKRGRKS